MTMKQSTKNLKQRWFMRLCAILLCVGISSCRAQAETTVTITATNADVSEQLDLRVIATLFGQAKDLQEFEQMINNPDSAFSNLDLNGDGDVDYLRVIETADQNRHLVVIQAVLAKDVYQDVASIFVDKEEESETVTVQVIGDEYIYGSNYIIEPVYIYRPLIYDWFWGPSWVCWHSPYYWDYWPGWWHPYHCIAHHLYWDHCYWYHHYHPICTYRTGHHHHPHYQPMRDRVSRSDYAVRHPERSFATRNASRNYSNARDIDRNRQNSIRNSANNRGNSVSSNTTRVSTRSTSSTDRTFGSSNVRSNNRITAAGNRSNTTRVENASTRSSATVNTASRSQSVTTTTPSRNSATTTRPSSQVNNTSRTAPRSSATPSRSSSSTTMRGNSSSSTMRSSAPATRSNHSAVHSSSSSMRSSGGGAMRSSGGSSSRGGGSTRR